MGQDFASWMIAAPLLVALGLLVMTALWCLIARLAGGGRASAWWGLLGPLGVILAGIRGVQLRHDDERRDRARRDRARQRHAARAVTASYPLDDEVDRLEAARKPLAPPLAPGRSASSVPLRPVLRRRKFARASSARPNAGTLVVGLFLVLAAAGAVALLTRNDTRGPDRLPDAAMTPPASPVAPPRTPPAPLPPSEEPHSASVPPLPARRAHPAPSAPQPSPQAPPTPPLPLAPEAAPDDLVGPGPAPAAVATPPVPLAAQEDVAKRKLLSEDAWRRTIEPGAKETELQRLTRLRELAAKCVIERRGRILDVVPAEGEDERVAIRVCGLTSVDPIARFPLPPEDASVVAGWSKWDGLAWKVLAHVDDAGAISYVALVQRAGDLIRSAGKGADVSPLGKSTGDAAAYMAWLKRYAWHCHARNWGDAWTALRTGSARTWLLRGEVSVVERGRAAVVLDGYTRLQERVGGTYTGRWWGVPIEAHWFEEIDPKLLAALAPGIKVEVTLDVGRFVAVQDLSARDGQFPFTMAIRRVVAPAPGSK